MFLWNAKTQLQPTSHIVENFINIPYIAVKEIGIIVSE